MNDSTNIAQTTDISKLNGKPSGQVNPEVFDPETEFNASLIDPDIDISEPPTVLTIDGHTVMTAGNISTTIGKAKGKKTFQSISNLAALISGREIFDKIQGHLERGKLIIWFDTEMSGYHLTRMAKRCIRLSGEFQPDNILIIGLRKYNPAERVQIITWALYHYKNIGFVFIDGIRDLLSKGINDEEEATTITSKLLKWTAELNIHVNVVLHQNKGDLNARGHVGTELVNKSETVISVNKHPDNPEISIVQPEFCRDKEFEPYAFLIDEHGLPALADMPATKQQAKENSNPLHISDEKHIEILNSIYRKNPTPNYKELIDSIIYGFGGVFGQTKARPFIAHYIENEWITKEQQGKYVKYIYNRALF